MSSEQTNPGPNEQLMSQWKLSRILPEDLSITDELEAGKPVLKITLKPGDMAERDADGNITSERAEITENGEPVPPGTDIWYGFSFCIPKDFKIDDNRLVIAQWKQPSSGSQNPGSPFLSYRYQGGKIIAQIVIDESVGGLEEESRRVKFKSSGLERGVWHRIVTNYQLDENNMGHCEFVVDGEVIGKYVGKMGYQHLPKEGTYFKMGLYRDPQEYSQSIYFDKFSRGTSADSLS